MSFILDALRKSEHERQRGTLPGISQVPLAGRRHGVPRWTLAIIGVLAIAVIALGAAWWHTLRRVPTAGGAPTTAATGDGAPAATTATPSVRPKLPTVQSERATANTERRGSALPVAAPPEPAVTEPTATPRAPAKRNETVARTGADAAQPAQTKTDSTPTLPSAAALAAEGIVVPELRLELHAYSDKPTERFVFINGRKYVEGDTLVEGPRVVSIEANGAVLSQQGHRFLLATQ